MAYYYAAEPSFRQSACNRGSTDVQRLCAAPMELVLAAGDINHLWS